MQFIAVKNWKSRQKNNQKETWYVKRCEQLGDMLSEWLGLSPHSEEFPDLTKSLSVWRLHVCMGFLLDSFLPY